MVRDNIGVIHGSVGLDDGVSIVMEQVEDVLVNQLGFTQDNIKYLSGISGLESNRVTLHEPLYFQHPYNQIVKNSYQDGFTPKEKELLEAQIEIAKEKVKSFIEDNDIKTIIAHNTCFPLNFLMSIGISRYLSECKEQGLEYPRYVVWWHDSHLERVDYSFPHDDMKPYLLEGLPGPYVDDIVFINSQQYLIAKEYFEELDEKNPGFMDRISKSHYVIYNTSDVFISSIHDLESNSLTDRTENFLTNYNVTSRLEANGASVDETIFLIQHTRMVERKRVDFALRYAFELLKHCKVDGSKKAVYFLVTGTNTNRVKESVKSTYVDLMREYKENLVFIDFVEEYPLVEGIEFFDYPLVFAHLGGLATYFSSIEGFGNNLLEVLASGLVPVIYEYPIFKTDLKQFEFKLLSTPEFVITDNLLEESDRILKDKELRNSMAQENLNILKAKLSHRTMADNLCKALNLDIIQITND